MLLGRGGLLWRRLLGASAPAAASGAVRGEATGGWRLQPARGISKGRGVRGSSRVRGVPMEECD